MNLHPATTKQDSTKINEYLTCEREYFFEFVLGYRSDKPSHDLEFGIAAHEGKAVLLEEGYSTKSIDHACEAFLESYRKTYGSDTDMDFKKNPASYRLGLEQYVIDYHTDNFKVVATEVGFSMLLSDDRVLYGRLDAIIEKDGKYYILETKTAGALWSYTNESFQQRFQVMAYTNFLYSYYPVEKVGGVIVDITIYTKQPSNVRVSVTKTPEQMLGWLVRTNKRFDALEKDFELLREDNNQVEYWKSDPKKVPPMRAFPKRESNCIQYNRICPYHDVCMARENPLIRRNFVPVGFKIDHWDCTAQKVKQSINIGKE